MFSDIHSLSKLNESKLYIFNREYIADLYKLFFSNNCINLISVINGVTKLSIFLRASLFAS